MKISYTWEKNGASDDIYDLIEHLVLEDESEIVKLEFTQDNKFNPTGKMETEQVVACLNADKYKDGLWYFTMFSSMGEFPHIGRFWSPRKSVIHSTYCVPEIHADTLEEAKEQALLYLKDFRKMFLAVAKKMAMLDTIE